MTSQDNVDKSQHAVNGGSIANATIVGIPRDIFLGIVLGISTIINVGLLYVAVESYKEQRLKEYDLDGFKTHDFQDVRTDISITKQLIADKCK